MRRWLDPRWYRYLWHRIGPDLRAVITVVALMGLGVGGFVAVKAIQGNPAKGVAFLTTSTRAAQVRGQRPITVERTRTITTVRGATIVTRRVVRYRPIYRPPAATATNRQLTTVTRSVTRIVTVAKPTTVAQPVTVAGASRTATVTVTETTTITVPAFTVSMTLLTVTVKFPTP